MVCLQASLNCCLLTQARCAQNKRNTFPLLVACVLPRCKSNAGFLNSRFCPFKHFVFEFTYRDAQSVDHISDFPPSSITDGVLPLVGGRFSCSCVQLSAHCGDIVDFDSSSTSCADSSTAYQYSAAAAEAEQ